jgi:hypothetical protein
LQLIAVIATAVAAAAVVLAEIFLGMNEWMVLLEKFIVLILG